MNPKPEVALKEVNEKKWVCMQRFEQCSLSRRRSNFTSYSILVLYIVKKVHYAGRFVENSYKQIFLDL
jgi:hypothetical protein